MSKATMLMFKCTILTILLAAATTTATSRRRIASGGAGIPASENQVNSWFQVNVKHIADRKGTLNSTLEAAEASHTTIRVRKDGSGDFTSILDAINGIPSGNEHRVVVDIGPGEYNQKVTIPKDKPFVTLKGSSKSMPTLTFGGTAEQYGTLQSATLQVLADFFVASNIIVKNSAPRPDGKRRGAQAVAMRLAGDKAAIYNCKLYGFQDTLADDAGRHFFKDCYVEGTVDFIFGNGKSLYLGTELHVLGQKGMTVITAQARSSARQDTGFSFVHCKVTGGGNGGGNGGGTLLGRAWFQMARVVFAYSQLSNAVSPAGWSDNRHPDRDRVLQFGEYQNTGPGAAANARAKFTHHLTAAQVKPYISLDYIQGSEWLLPPPKA